MVGAGINARALAIKSLEMADHEIELIMAGRHETFNIEDCIGAGLIINEIVEVAKERNIKLDDMSISEMIQFIRQNPTVLKRPIMVDDSHIQVGYDTDEMTTFIPRERRLQGFVCDTCEDSEK